MTRFEDSRAPENDTAAPSAAPAANRPTASATSPAEQRERAVRALQEAMNIPLRRFAVETGLRCPERCGRCCLSPEVETTVIDLLPMASEIVRRGLAGAILDRLDEPNRDRRCILYEPDSDDPARGRCSMYQRRPSVCRLYGFAGRRDADGRPRFVPCRVHREVMPEVADAAIDAVESGRVALPIYGDLAGRIAALAPGDAGRPQPINDALREAIHAAGLSARLTAATAEQAMIRDESDRDDDGTRPSPSPTIPRRAA